MSKQTYAEACAELDAALRVLGRAIAAECALAIAGATVAMKRLGALLPRRSRRAGKTP